MALIEEFESGGNWLFRKRSYLPLVLYLPAVALIWAEQDKDMDHRNAAWILCCLSVTMLGQLVRALTIGYTPRNTSGRNTGEGQVAAELNTSGIYAMVRHPLYFGNFFMWMGLVLYVGNFWFSLSSSLVYWLYYERIMFAEEQFLRRKFGEKYLEWSKNTPAFLPKLGLWKRPGLPFSLRNVLKREYSGFFAVFLSFCIINGLKNFRSSGVLKVQELVDPLWLWLLVASGVAYLVLRSLKKYTRLLHVEGR